MWGVRHLNVPYSVQRELLEIARWEDIPKGDSGVNLASWSYNSMSSTLSAICWLPWNKNRRPIKRY